MHLVRTASTPEAEGPDHALARVQAAVRGDREAIARLLGELVPRIRNLVRFLVRGDSDVDDIAQEAMVVVLRGLPTYRGEGPFGKWLDRVVVRSTFADLRRRRAERSLVAIAEDPPVLADHRAQPDEYLLRRWAVRVLDELPDDQRYAVALHHVLGMSVPEVAAEVGAPQETIRSRLRLARARLRARGIDLANAAAGNDVLADQDDQDDQDDARGEA
jgi:RNA polymerase sigma-70 factor (ECF subfamily)